MRLEVSSLSEIGLKRTYNEDAVLVWQDDACSVFAVADGMGGCKNGGQASRAVTEHLMHWLMQPGQCWDGIAAFMYAAEAELRAVNDHILTTFGRETPTGSTCVLAAVQGESLGIYSVGDSRAYLLRGLRLTPLTHDDVWENQESVRRLYSKRERIQHPDYGKLVQAVGLRKSWYGTILTEQLHHNDVLLLCSDGVYKPCPHWVLFQAAIHCRLRGPETAARMLRQAVYRRGAGDNLSFIFIWFL